MRRKQTKHIWIIRSTTATNLFYRNYSEMNIDPDLLSGLLSALDNFSNVELKTNQGISSIEMGGLRWSYSHHRDTSILIIGADKITAHANMMRSQLEVIYKSFQEKYKITSEKMENPLINTVEFKDFSEELDTLVQQWAQVEALVQGGAIEIFDILGIFQQLFNLCLEIFQKNLSYDNVFSITKELTWFLKELRRRDEFKDIEEFDKIEIGLSGWNLINLNPMLIKKIEIEQFLFEITRKINEIFGKRLAKMERLYAYSAGIYPFINQQFELLDKLKILQPFLRIFLN